MVECRCGERNLDGRSYLILHNKMKDMQMQYRRLRDELEFADEGRKDTLIRLMSILDIKMELLEECIDTVLGGK